MTKFIEKFGRGAGKIIGLLLSAGHDAVDMVITTVLPFMCFIAALVGIITSTGIGDIIAKLVQPLGGSVIGMIILSLVCTIPIISPLLAPGAVIAQVVGVFIGIEIGAGNIAPALAVPAIFAINGQVGCDFIPVGLALADAEPETVEIATPAVLLNRFVTGPIAVLVGWVFSFGLF